MLLQTKALKLFDEEWTCLLATLAVPVKTVPALLGRLVAAARRDAEVWEHLPAFLEKAVQTLQRLLDMMYAMEPPVVPRRVAAQLHATQLQPEAVCEWMRATAAAALAHMQATGSHRAPAYLSHVLRAILATDHFEGVKDAVQGKPAVQSAVVEFAERVLALPLEQQAALAGDAKRCATLRDLAETAAVDCLAGGRRRCASLLPAAANLAACPELQAQRGSPEQGGLLMACLELQAVLLHDLIDHQPGCSQLQLTYDHLRAMGCQGGLPLLCTLAAEVAAAAPGGGSGSGSSGGGSSTPDSAGFGPWCWKEAAGDWQVCLHRWLLVLGPLTSRGVEQRICDLQSCLGSWRAAEALLRMLPSLPAQPGSELRSGRWRTAAGDVAAAGGLEELRSGSGLVQQHNGPMLALGALHVGQHLLEAAVPVAVGAEQTPEAAQAAFELLSTACRAVHSVAPALRPGGSVGAGTESSFFVRNDITDFFRLLDGATSLALRTSQQLLPTLRDAEQRAAAERWVLDLAFVQVTSGRPLRLQDMGPFGAPLTVLGAAVRLVQEPALVRHLAQHFELLGMLCKAASGFQLSIVQGCPQGVLDYQRLPPSRALAALWPVVTSLAPHMPGLQGPQRAALLQALAPLPSPGTLLDLQGLEAVLQALHRAHEAAAEARQLAAAAAPAEADPEQVQALALRRAHALALRRGCGNPRCAILAGACEAEAKASRCSGCRLLRFCGQACSKQDWRWHKLACRALRDEAGA